MCIVADHRGSTATAAVRPSLPTFLPTSVCSATGHLCSSLSAKLPVFMFRQSAVCSVLSEQLPAVLWSAAGCRRSGPANLWSGLSGRQVYGFLKMAMNTVRTKLKNCCRLPRQCNVCPNVSPPASLLACPRPSNTFSQQPSPCVHR